MAFQPEVQEMSLEEKVQYAYEAGTTEEEIRRNVAQGNARIRQDVDRALSRIVRVSKGMPEDARDDLVSTLGVSGDEPLAVTAAAVSSGQGSQLLDRAAERGRGAILETPVDKVVSPETAKEDMDFVRASYFDRNHAALLGLKESMRNLGPSDAEEVADIGWLEAAQAENRKVSEHIKAQRVALQTAIETSAKPRDESGQGWTKGDDSFNWDLFWNMSSILLPTLTVENISKASAGIDAGFVDPGFWTYAKAFFLPYEQSLEMRDVILKMSPEEGAAAVAEFRERFMNSVPEWMRKDLAVYMMSEEVVPYDAINTPEQNASMMERILVGAMYMLGTGVETASAASAVLTGGTSLLAAGPTTSILKRAIGAVQAGWRGWRNPTSIVRAGRRAIAQSGVTARLAQIQNPKRLQAAWIEEARANASTRAGQFATTGQRQVEIASAQLPGPGASAAPNEAIVNVPDGVFSAAEEARLVQLEAGARSTANRLTGGFLDTSEQFRVVDEVIQELEASVGARARPALSDIEVHDDGLGVNLNMTFGMDDTRGFNSLQAAVDWAQNDAGLKVPWKVAKVMPDGTLKEVLIKPTLVNGKLVVPNTPGEYFIRAGFEHLFTPDDVRYFGGDFGAPVITGAWQGKQVGFWTNPSAIFDPKTVGRYTRSYLREQRLASQLEAITAPIFKMSRKAQRKINDMLGFAEKFAEENAGALPTPAELKAKFGANADEMKGYYTARFAQDVMWEIQNRRLYQDWKAKGYRTFYKTGGPRYHGKFIARNKLDKARSKYVYDAETGKTRELTDSEIDTIYQNGGKIMEVDLPLTGSKGREHKLVLMEGQKGWVDADLDRHVLKYKSGYNTRMYQDAYFVKRVKDNGRMDGKQEKLERTMRTASTYAEAQAFRERAFDAIGRRIYKTAWDRDAPMKVKEQMLADKGYRLEISKDSRLTDMDRIQVDLDRFKMEGRLFFDDRQPTALRNTENQMADVVDPLNVVQRTAKMISRQVSNENLVSSQKQRFFQKYGRYFSHTPTDESSRIEASIKKIITERPPNDPDAIRMTHALAWWRYIRFMEGSLNNNPAAFRKHIIQLSEWVDLKIGGKLGLRDWTKPLARKLGNASIVNATKSLTFLHFLTARPVRQLAMQGAQHLNLLPIDPTYAGKWQLDTFSLLSAVKRVENTEEGRAIMALKKKQAARMMGLDDEEMDILLEEFQMSGIVDGVDVHSFAGGKPKSSVTLGETPAGDMVGAGISAARYIPDKARAYGFDLGETINVTASYLLALRRHTKEKGIKSIKDLTRQDWDDIAARGSGYALAMHKANAAMWQYGLLSLPLQFLQYTHKWLLTMLGASKTMRKMGLANQAFTVQEARRIVVGQMIMWGGAGFALKDHIRDFVDTEWQNLPKEARDILAGGLVDWSLDTLMRNLGEDEDLDFAWEEMGAPGQGLAMFIENWIEIVGGEVSPGEAYMGASGTVFDRLATSAKYIGHIFGEAGEDLSPTDKAYMTAIAVGEGLFSGFSDGLKVMMAHRMNTWTMSTGQALGIKAKFEELVVKGVLGVNPQIIQDSWDLRESARDMVMNVQDNAKAHVKEITSLWLKAGKTDEERFLAQVRGLSGVFDLYENIGELQLYKDSFMAEMRRIDTDSGKSLLQSLVEHLSKGFTGDPVTFLVERGFITDPQEEARIRATIERQKSLEPRNIQKFEDNIKRDVESARRQANGN